MLSLFKRIFPKKVKSRLLATIGILLTVMIGVPTYLSYKNTIESANSKLAESLKITITQVRKTIVEEKAEQLRLLAYTVAGMPSVQDYLKFQDRDSMEEFALPLFEQLKKITALNVFHFHLPPATSFLRLQKPEKFGDDLSSFRKTVVAVNQTQKEAIGIEAGVAGISIRAVIPVLYLNKKHIGSVEFGAPLNDEALASIKENLGNDISVIVPDGSKFKYQAKTHNLSIPEKAHPFLKKVFDSKEIFVKRVSKNDREFLTAYMPLKDYSGNSVGILAIPQDIGATLSEAKRKALISVALGLITLIVIQILVYFLFIRLVDRPIRKFTVLLESASRGDLTQSVDMSSIKPVNCSETMACNNPDCSMYGKEGYCWEEAGSAAVNIECPKITSGEYASCSECKKSFKAAVQDEFAELSAYMHAFVKNIRKLVGDVNTNSVNLNESAEKLSELSSKIDNGSTGSAELTNNVATAAEEMSSNMSSVAAATEEAAANVNVMTTATEEIKNTVGEIQESTENAKSITGKAVSQASEISVKVDELGSAAADIGNVTETIAEISDQTNLLALNATIEAARAGEAGKGFAVVANEIKELAKQTAEATGEIKERIDGIQASTGTTVDGIKQISEIITEIDDIVSKIALSLEEQNATMAELIANISQAGEGIGEVSENVAQSSNVSQQISQDIAEVSRVATTISSDTSEVNKNAEELKEYSQALKSLIEKFKI